MIRCFAGTRVLFVIGVLGCTTVPTDPAVPEAGGLRLDGSITSSTVLLGEQAVLTFRLSNLSEETVRLDFGSSCQITPFIETAGGRDVYPGGGYACLTVLTSLTLLPRGEHLTTMEVFGGHIRPDTRTGYPLPVGRYSAYAILENNSRRIELRSAYVEFEVR